MNDFGGSWRRASGFGGSQVSVVTIVQNIAFVGAADGGNNGGVTNSLSYSYSVGSGTNRALFVGILGDTLGGGADDITSVTYNSIPMSLITKLAPINAAGGNRWSYLYCLLNPPSGANTVAISATGSHWLLSGAADYTNVRQSSQPEVFATNSATDITLATSLTTLTNNAWTILFANSQPLKAGVGSTMRAFEPAFEAWIWCDSNGPISPAGSTSMTVDTKNAAYDIGAVMISIARFS